MMNEIIENNDEQGSKLKNEFRVKEVNRTFLATVLVSVLAATVIYYACIGVGKIYGFFVPSVGDAGEKIYSALLGNSYMSLLLSQILLFLPTFIFLCRNRKYFVVNLRIKKLKIKTYLMIAGFGLFFIPIITFINSLSLLFTENVIASEVSGSLAEHSFAASLVVIAVLPCILEEVIYRGVFYNEYSRINPAKAVLLSALLFGLLHMNFNQFLYAAVGGMVFALMVEATDSITASMIMHFMINGSSVLVSYISLNSQSSTVSEAADINTLDGAQSFSGSLSFMNNLTALEQTIVILGVFSLFCLIVEIVLYFQIAMNEGRYEYVKGLFKKNRIETNSNGKQKMVTPSLVIAMAICLIVMVIRQFM